MDFNNLSGMLKDNNMDMPGMPDMSNLTGALSKPDYEQSKEFGAHRNGKEFNALTDYDLPSLDIDVITFRAGAILDGIIVTYSDGSTVQHGGNGGSAYKVSLKGDGIKKITGYSNVNFGGKPVISGISIETVKGKKYGPFGSIRSGSPFEISKSGYKIAAFFGSMDGAYIGSIGAFLVK